MTTTGMSFDMLIPLSKGKRTIPSLIEPYHTDPGKGCQGFSAPDPKERLVDHVEATAIPSRDSVIDILALLEDILYPGYFGQQELNDAFDQRAEQIAASAKSASGWTGLCVHCVNLGQQQALEFLRKVPRLRPVQAPGQARSMPPSLLVRPAVSLAVPEPAPGLPRIRVRGLTRGHLLARSEVFDAGEEQGIY